MAEDAEFAISMPGSNLWGQTFIKRYQAFNQATGTYTYTSELKKMQDQSGATQKTMYLGWFHVGNDHIESENRQIYDKMHINHSHFGRDVLHCIESVNFNPWSVLERFPVEEAQPG